MLNPFLHAPFKNIQYEYKAYNRIADVERSGSVGRALNWGSKGL